MFQKSIIEKYLSKLDTKLLREKYELFCANYKNETKIANIRALKEEQYQEGFIRDVFCSVLNYTIKPEPDYNILTELKNETKNKNNARKSDGAICEENDESRVRAVIELKGTDTIDLDTVARQAFDYKSHHENCNYAIVCNFERLRLYVETQIEFVEFNLFTLTFEDFCLLYLLLELNQLKNDIPLKLKHETLSEEKQITDNFYSDYSTFKRSLFEDIIENNPAIDKLVLFKKTQKLLDRILFVLFCEDRGLLPANSVMGIIGDYQKLKEMGYGQPLYSVFKTYFDRIDKGYKSESDSTKSIFAYNGGLFKPDEILDNLKVGDDVLFIHSKRLADYDFESQISVDILGRIFENSLTEIEEVQKEIEAEKSGEKVENNNVGKRKKDGVFYTPEYITKYIVENTIGKLCEQKREELNISDEAVAKAQTKKQKDSLNTTLHEYQEWLFSLKILDPACGSGAFLTAALTQLKTEHRRVFDFLHAINNDTMMFDEYSDNSILENNLYGVDINEESVEITKLSLWLHTAQKDRKLTTLNNKIKCGNSLIDDPAIAGEKAFDWEKEFPEVFCRSEGNKPNKGLKPLVSLSLSPVSLEDIDIGTVDFSKESLWHITTPTHNSRYSQRVKDYNVVLGKPVELTLEEEVFIYEKIVEIVKEKGYKVFALNICKDHLHILLSCEEKQLPEIMQMIKGRTSYEWRKNGLAKSEHLWAQKYYSKQVRDYLQLENTINYIKHNREKHGLEPLKKIYKDSQSKGGFDIVIGNPPYVTRNLDQITKDYINAKFETAEYQVDLYVSFIEQGIKLIKQEGYNSFIVPNSWLKNLMMEKCRKFLLEKFNLIKIAVSKEAVFSDASVDSLVYIGTKAKEQNDRINIFEIRKNEFIYKHDVSKERILQNEKNIFDIEVNDAIIPIIEKMKINVSKIKDLFDVCRGINPYDKYTGQSPEIIASRAYHADYKKDETFEPELKGRHIDRYSENWDGKSFISYGDWLAAPREQKYFTGTRIVFREILGKTLVTTVLTKDIKIDRSLYIALPINETVDVYFVDGILNSPLMSFYFRYSNNEFDDLFPKMRVAEFKELPIKNTTLENQKTISLLVKKMLTLNETLQKSSNRFINRIKENLQISKITATLEKFYELEFKDFVKELAKQKVKLSLKQQDEWEEYFTEYKNQLQELQTQITATDKQINTLVYKLYDLTEEEIKIVEGR